MLAGKRLRTTFNFSHKRVDFAFLLVAAIPFNRMDNLLNEQSMMSANLVTAGLVVGCSVAPL